MYRHFLLGLLKYFKWIVQGSESKENQEWDYIKKMSGLLQEQLTLKRQVSQKNDQKVRLNSCHVIQCNTLQ